MAMSMCWPRPVFWRARRAARGVEGADGLVVDAQPLDDAGAKALDDDVGGLGQTVEYAAGLVVAEVEDDAALVAPQGVEGEGTLGVFSGRLVEGAAAGEGVG